MLVSIIRVRGIFVIVPVRRILAHVIYPLQRILQGIHNGLIILERIDIRLKRIFQGIVIFFGAVALFVTAPVTEHAFHIRDEFILDLSKYLGAVFVCQQLVASGLPSQSASGVSTASSLIVSTIFR